MPSTKKVDLFLKRIFSGLIPEKDMNVYCVLCINIHLRSFSRIYYNVAIDNNKRDRMSVDLRIQLNLFINKTITNVNTLIAI